MFEIDAAAAPPVNTRLNQSQTDWVVYVIQSLEQRVEEMSAQISSQARDADALEHDMRDISEQVRALVAELGPLNVIPHELKRLLDRMDQLTKNHEVYIARLADLESCERDFRHYCSETADNHHIVSVTREMVLSTGRVMRAILWLVGTLMTVGGFAQFILPFLKGLQ